MPSSNSFLKHSALFYGFCHCLHPSLPRTLCQSPLFLSLLHLSSSPPTSYILFTSSNYLNWFLSLRTSKLTLLPVPTSLAHLFLILSIIDTLLISLSTLISAASIPLFSFSVQLSEPYNSIGARIVYILTLSLHFVSPPL